MNRNDIILVCDFVLKSAIDTVITWYWLDFKDDIFTVKYLPLPSYQEKDMHKFKKNMNLIFLSAEDNEVFKYCKLRNIHKMV